MKRLISQAPFGRLPLAMFRFKACIPINLKLFFVAVFFAVAACTPAVVDDVSATAGLETYRPSPILEHFSNADEEKASSERQQVVFNESMYTCMRNAGFDDFPYQQPAPIFEIDPSIAEMSETDYASEYGLGLFTLAAAT